MEPAKQGLCRDQTSIGPRGKARQVESSRVSHVTLCILWQGCPYPRRHPLLSIFKACGKQRRLSLIGVSLLHIPSLMVAITQKLHEYSSTSSFHTLLPPSRSSFKFCSSSCASYINHHCFQLKLSSLTHTSSHTHTHTQFVLRPSPCFGFHCNAAFCFSLRVAVSFGFLAWLAAWLPSSRTPSLTALFLLLGKLPFFPCITFSHIKSFEVLLIFYSLIGGSYARYALLGLL